MKTEKEEQRVKSKKKQIMERLSWKSDNNIVFSSSLSLASLYGVMSIGYIIFYAIGYKYLETIIGCLFIALLSGVVTLVYVRLSKQTIDIDFENMDGGTLSAILHKVKIAVKLEIAAWTCSILCLFFDGLVVFLIPYNPKNAFSTLRISFLLGLILIAGFALGSKFIYSRLSLKNRRKKAPKNIRFNLKIDDSQSLLKEDNRGEKVLLSDRQVFVRELDHALSFISDASVNRDIRGIKDSMIDIYAMAEKDGTVEKQIRKFSAHYMPMTVKLLNMYIDTCRKKVQTSETKKLKTEIGQMIGDVNTAFGNLNRELFEQSSVDSEVHMEALKNILESDGLLNSQEMVMPKQDED